MSPSGNWTAKNYEYTKLQNSAPVASENKDTWRAPQHTSQTSVPKPASGISSQNPLAAPMTSKSKTGRNAMTNGIDIVFDILQPKYQSTNHKPQTSNTSEHRLNAVAMQRMHVVQNPPQEQNGSLRSELKFLFKSMLHPQEPRVGTARIAADLRETAASERSERFVNPSTTFDRPPSPRILRKPTEELRPAITGISSESVPVPGRRIPRKTVPEHLPREKFNLGPQHAVKVLNSPVHQNSVKVQRKTPPNHRYKRSEERVHSHQTRFTQFGDFMVNSTTEDSSPPPLPETSEPQGPVASWAKAIPETYDRCTRCESEPNAPGFDYHPVSDLWMCEECLKATVTRETCHFCELEHDATDGSYIQQGRWICQRCIIASLSCGFCNEPTDKNSVRDPKTSLWYHPLCLVFPEAEVVYPPTPNPYGHPPNYIPPRKPLPQTSRSRDPSPLPITQSTITRAHSPLSMISRSGNPNGEPYSSDGEISPVSDESWEIDVPEDDEPTTPPPPQNPFSKGKETAPCLAPIANVSPLMSKRVASSVYPEDELAGRAPSMAMPMPQIPDKYKREFEGQKQGAMETLEGKAYSRPEEERESRKAWDQRETYYGLLTEYAGK